MTPKHQECLAMLPIAAASPCLPCGVRLPPLFDAGSHQHLAMEGTNLHFIRYAKYTLRQLYEAAGA